MSTWVNGEKGPECGCGAPTSVMIDKGKALLFCFAHTREAGAMFPLPAAKPVKWPDMTTEEMIELIDVGIAEHGGDDGS